jgi:protein-disulfide isomerase
MAKLGRIVAKHGYVFVVATALAGTAYASWLHLWPHGARQCGAAELIADAACVEPATDDIALADDVRVEIPTAGLPHKGAASDAARVTMIECSDFQCPFSRRAAGTVDELIRRNDDLAFFHTHYPLVPMHEHALLMARTSVAAQRQDRFWDMHDAMFATRVESEAAAIALARRLGLDVARFVSDLDDADVHAEVERQRRLCRDAGVRGVPTFFINGRRVVGSLPTDQLQRVIDEERRATRP